MFGEVVQECHAGRLTGRMGREKINEETPFKRLLLKEFIADIPNNFNETEKQVR